MFWHHMLTRDVIEAAETTVRHGWEVDALLEDNGGALARLHLAEVLARSAARQQLTLPAEDPALVFSLRFYPVSPHRWHHGGSLVVTDTGLVGYALGDGRVVESTGPSLCIVREPGNRYVAGYRHPTITHF